MQKRLFLALSYDTNQECKNLQKEVIKRLESLDSLILKPQRYLHFTLCFIGDLPDEELLKLLNACKEALVIHQKEFGMQSLAHASSVLTMRILNDTVIAGTFEPCPALVNLYALLQTTILKHTARKLLPHITFARIKKIKEHDKAVFKSYVMPLLDTFSQQFCQPIDLSASEIILFLSTNGIYEPLATFLL